MQQQIKEGLFYGSMITGAISANVGMTAFLRWYTKALHGFKALGNRGEGAGDAGAGDAGAGAGDAGAGAAKAFTQEDMNRVIANERRNIEGRYAGYEDLVKFKTEHEKQLSVAEQQRLEEAGKYDEAKKGYEGKISEITGVISQKDLMINDLKTGFAIQNEVSAQGAYGDAVDLIKGLAVVQEDGSVKIKGKDANGIDTLLDVKTGVEQFLKAKPYLVKAAGTGGSGSATGGGQGDTGAGGGQDLAVLNSQLAAAMSAGDKTTANEVGAKIRALQTSRKISPHI